ncbi:MAG: alanine racemase, partial [Thermoanaerobacteraceae bacterium]|nr:alanine racemase [Thermoanaerobacteraceae bacterium]
MLPETPYLELDMQKLKYNIEDMAAFAREHNLNLRPHAKAHKLIPVAQIQLKYGAIGLTVSKLGEMETFLKGGIKDLYLVYELATASKIKHLLKLASEAKITTTVDNPYHVKLLSELASASKQTMDVMIEVDTGLHRCGVCEKEDALKLAQLIEKMPGVRLKGLMTHAGHVYGVQSPEQVVQIGRQEGELLAEYAGYLKKQGFPVEVVSVGSTPTAKIAGKVNGVTEIRPGNYCFYDAIQVGLGVVPVDRCALKVRATVISRSADRRRFVIDAGSKTFALDKGAHGTELVDGFGIIVNYPHLRLARLSEEHGIIEVKKEANRGPLPEIGETLDIVPNHACPVINLAEAIYVRDGDK